MNSETGIKFRNFSGIWLDEYAQKNFTVISASKYPSMLTIINKGIGNISLSRMTAQAILDFCSGLQKNCVGTVRLKVDFSELLSQKCTTRAEIQKKSGVAPSTMAAFARNEKISEKSARVFAKTLKMPFNDLFEADEPKAVSYKTAKNYLSLVSSVLEFAVERGIIKFNVAKSVVLKSSTVASRPSKDKEGITAEDITEILKKLEEEPVKWAAGIYIVLDTRITRGELLGLEWKDIDLNARRMQIRRSSQVVRRKGIIETGGSFYRNPREIELDKATVDILRKYREWQQNEIKTLGNKWHGEIEVALHDGTTEIRKNDRLFTAKNGDPMNPDSYTDWVSRFCRKHGLRSFDLKMIRKIEH